MSVDVEIDGWLASRGFGPGSRALARRALEEAGLTREGKSRISEAKLARASEAIAAGFYLHCQRAACVQSAVASGRAAISAEPTTHCESCGGSENRRAQSQLIDACRSRGIRRIVIVGGSPAVREELASLLGQQLELRSIDGTERRTAERAKADLEWADLVLIWGGTELDHKVSSLYTHSVQHRPKVVHVARRGIAALLSAAIEHLEKQRSPQGRRND